MNADRLARRLRQRSRLTFWGERAYPSIRIGPDLLETKPPDFTYPAWSDYAQPETLPDGRTVISDVTRSSSTHPLEDEYVYRTRLVGGILYADALVGSSFIYNPDDPHGFGEPTPFAHPEILEPMAEYVRWKDLGTTVFIAPLATLLENAVRTAKTSYLERDPRVEGGAILTLAVKTNYASRIQRTANALRTVQRWARRYGFPLHVVA